MLGTDKSGSGRLIVPLNPRSVDHICPEYVEVNGRLSGSISTQWPRISPVRGPIWA